MEAVIAMTPGVVPAGVAIQTGLLRCGRNDEE